MEQAGEGRWKGREHLNVSFIHFTLPPATRRDGILALAEYQQSYNWDLFLLRERQAPGPCVLLKISQWSPRCGVQKVNNASIVNQRHLTVPSESRLLQLFIFIPCGSALDWLEGKLNFLFSVPLDML